MSHINYSYSAFDKSSLDFDVDKSKWISIDKGSCLYSLLLTYVSNQLIKTKSKASSFKAMVLPRKDKDVDEDTEEESKLEDDACSFERVRLNLGFGQFTFYAPDGLEIHAVHQQVGEPVGLNYEVAVMESLIVFSDGPVERLAKFLSDLVDMSEVFVEGKFKCFTWDICNEYWRQESHNTARPLSSVVLPSAMKDRVVKDLEKFLSRKTKSFYSRNGIPYRRSYLFYGVPGTGKTSMVQALAGHFKRSVCYLMPTHPKMTDDSLRAAIRKLPANTIVVFEDIDALFSKDRKNQVQNSCLTFSGLLNALDGIGDPNGQIFVLTTNLREQLDSALIRNGRVDQQVEFTFAVAEQMETMWNSFYPEGTHLAKEFSTTLVKILAENSQTVTTSGLQHFFIAQMDATAEEALGQVGTISEEIRIRDLEAQEVEKEGKLVTGGEGTSVAESLETKEVE